MQILMNSGGVASTNSYLIADEDRNLAVLFDAPNDTARPLIEAAKQRGWDVQGLWLTHGHFDHLADHAVVTKAFPEARLLIHSQDESKLIQPGSTLFPLPFKIPPRKADDYLRDDQELHIGALRIRVIHTPGHSPGHVMFHFPEEEVLVGGDLIIMGAVGRTDLPDASEAELNGSIRRIMRLPPHTRLLPGHGKPTTLAEERENNAYVQAALGREV